MKAMVLDQYHNSLDWRDVPDPEFDADEVVIRVGANGLCATDLKIVEGLVPTVPLPHIMGHEVAGEPLAPIPRRFSSRGASGPYIGSWLDPQRIFPGPRRQSPGDILRDDVS